MLKIAFLKLCCPGDLIFTTPAIRAVKKKFPDAKLTFITGGYSSFIPDHNPRIDDTIILNPPFETTSKLEAIKEVICGISKIRKEKYDIFICFHRSRILAFLGFASRAKSIVGFTSCRPFVNSAIDFNPNKQESLRYLDLVKTLKCNVEDTEFEYRTLPKEDKEAEEFLKKYQIKNKFIVVAPGGGENPGTIMHIKRWPAYRFRNIVKYIQEKYKIPVISVGSKSELKIGDEVKPDLNLAGKTTLPLLAAIMKRSLLVIANDSGPLYLASALGIKTIGIYGPSSEKLVAPLTTNHISVYGVTFCRPCYSPDNVKRGTIHCPTGSWACMLTLSSKKVYAAVDKHLGNGARMEYVTLEKDS